MYRLILGHFRFNCRPILSYSSSSKIPGTCDIQTCCCCSNFSLGVQFMYFLICVERDFRKRFGHHNYNFWGSLSHYNTVYTAHGLFANLLCTASFLGIFALTVDRFLAIHLHLRYREPVTYRRVVAVVISVWVFSSCISLFVLNGILENVLDIITITSGAVCLTTTGLIYCKIYSIVRHHTNQHALQLQEVSQNQNGEMANAARLKKTELATFYVYVLFLACLLPFLCVRTAIRMHGESVLRIHLLRYSMTLVFLNSSLNPLIYCWKMRNIRQAVMSVLRNIFQSQ